MHVLDMDPITRFCTGYTIQSGTFSYVACLLGRKPNGSMCCVIKLQKYELSIIPTKLK